MQSREFSAAHGAHGGPTGKARLPGVAKYRAMTESELAESFGEFPVEVGEAQPTGVAKYSATAVATTEEKSIGVSEARPPGIAKYTATSKSFLAEPPGDPGDGEARHPRDCKAHGHAQRHSSGKVYWRW